MSELDKRFSRLGKLLIKHASNVILLSTVDEIKWQVLGPRLVGFIDNFPFMSLMKEKVFVITVFLVTGTRQSYGDPQDLTEMVREVLKDKKPIAEKKIDKNTTNDSHEDVKERSKI